MVFRSVIEIWLFISLQSYAIEYRQREYLQSVSQDLDNLNLVYFAYSGLVLGLSQF